MSKQEFAKTATLGVAAQKNNHIELSDVIYVATEKLKPNQNNSLFFGEESAEYFERLRQDIQERGIIVPLIAKSDNTLLAGDNRLRVAREIGLDKVPVQYVDKPLSEAEEKEFLVKDNLYRRQLAQHEWIAVYRLLYPGFDERVKEKVTRRKPDDTSNEPLTAREIARATGQKERTVQHQLQKHRESMQPKPDQPAEADVMNEISNQFMKIHDLIDKRGNTCSSDEITTLLEQQIFSLQKRIEMLTQSGGNYES